MINIAFIYENSKFGKQIEYSINTIFQSYNVNLTIFDYESYDYESFDKNKFDLILSYGLITNKEDVLINKGNLFSDDYLKKESLVSKVERYKDIPVFFRDHELNYFVKETENKITFNIDLLQTTFYFLTLYEEYVYDEFDKYGRANINNSILFKENLISRAVVNETITYFINMINTKFNIKIDKKNSWNNGEFSVVLSHDVDTINKYLSPRKELHLLLSLLLIDKEKGLVLDRIKGYFLTKILKKRKDSFYTFDYLLELEKKFGFKSSYYFMTDSSFDYSIDDAKAIKLMEQINSANCEIGFHPGIGTSDNEQKFIEQLNRLKNVSKGKFLGGVRQHYLSFYTKKTWKIQSDNNILYDTSICYPQVAGFKTGYCLPYRAFDLENNEVLNTWEIPLIVMEGTLIEYMRLSQKESMDYIDLLISEVKKYNGVFVLLWHNSALNEEYCSFSKELLEDIYNKLANMNCLVDSGLKILEAYLRR